MAAGEHEPAHGQERETGQGKAVVPDDIAAPRANGRDRGGHEMFVAADEVGSRPEFVAAGMSHVPVDHRAQGFAIDGQQAIAGEQTGLVSRAARPHVADLELMNRETERRLLGHVDGDRDFEEEFDGRGDEIGR